MQIFYEAVFELKFTWQLPLTYLLELATHIGAFFLHATVYTKQCLLKCFACT